MKICNIKYMILFSVCLLTMQNIDGICKIVPLETQHLILRKMEIDDAQDIAKIALNSKVTQLTGLFPQMSSLEEVQDYIATFLVGDSAQGINPLYSMTWSMVDKKSQQVIGLVVFCGYSERHQRAELAYAVLPDYWNCGYTTQACQAIIKYALDQGICRIYATVDPENIASQRVLEKLGMSYEGLLRSYMIVGGERKDRKIYAIVK
jgi:ribosomal-protein-alanine N-acetyltransferase